METTTAPHSEQKNFLGYQLDERRTDRYTFLSMKRLVRYFSTWLDEEETEAVIEKGKVGFQIRQGADKATTQLQMIKKCEYAMVRILRKGPR